MVMNRCRSCRFFEASDKPKEGWCRRYPPFHGGVGHAWPPVYDNDYCGEHKPRAGKKEKPNTGANEVIAYYCETFKDRFGENPTITGKDAGAATRMLKTHTIAEVNQRINEFFANTPKFYEENVLYGLNHVESAWDKMTVRSAQKQEDDTYKKLVNEQAKDYGNHELFPKYARFVNDMREMKTFEEFLSEFGD